ncbi:MAG: SurA N-terminal domain-containing protein [Candidatus Hydrogenedentes bacterium]|nr:SurA N-terminal domain-containing protein [Candidatus Hydrogenedentota bacterium]
MHIFRDHKRALLVFMFFAIGVPMLFFGIPWGDQGFNAGDVELARVGGVPVMASEFYRNLDAARQRMTRGDESPTFKELHEQGVAGNVLDEMISSALIRREEQKRGFRVDRSLVEERLRDDASFKDDAGNFIPSRYNAWVSAQEGRDWTPIYKSIQEGVAREVYMTTVLAPANRVLDREIERELIDRSTKIQIEYLKVEPAVTPTDEEIQQEYDENKEAYRKPAKHTADYVAISLLPEPSEEVLDIVSRARAGEDFAALADAHSDLITKNGGDLDWVAEREVELDYRKPLFALGAGEISDPVRGPNGFYIYKVEDVRENEDTGQTERKARHIYVQVDLSEEERTARIELAQAISAKAAELKGLPAALGEVEGAGNLAVRRAAGISTSDPEIEGVALADAPAFRSAVVAEAGRKKSEEALTYPVVTGKDTLYVAELVSTEEGIIPELAEVRDQVADDVRQKKKNEEAYREEAAALAERIKVEAATLDEAKAKFPDATAEIKETRPFTKADFLFQEQLYLQTSDVYAAIEGKPEGQVLGPLTDFLGGTYLIALTNRQEPTEEDKANWDEEGKRLREQRTQMAQMQMLQDYLEFLRERELNRIKWDININVYNSVVGIRPDEAATPLEIEIPAVEGAESSGADAAAETPAEGES